MLVPFPSVIDVHAHLQDEAFAADLREVIRRAKAAGVNGIVSAGVDFSDSVACLEVAREYDMVRAAVGLAPYSDLSRLQAVLQLIEDSPDIVAIGEVGLDYNREKRPEQIEPFRKQVAVAMELDVPVVVHSRSAGRYCIEVLDAMKAEKVVMHAFDGSVKNAQRGFELGYCFSIPLTVLKNPQKQALAKAVPEEQLLLETDSPVMDPDGGRNEPANLVRARDFVAELRGVEPGDLEALTEKNAHRIFGF
jgi:TatD DNase family protein